MVTSLVLACDFIAILESTLHWWLDVLLYKTGPPFPLFTKREIRTLFPPPLLPIQQQQQQQQYWLLWLQVEKSLQIILQLL